MFERSDHSLQCWIHGTFAQPHQILSLQTVNWIKAANHLNLVNYYWKDAFLPRCQKFINSMNNPKHISTLIQRVVTLKLQHLSVMIMKDLSASQVMAIQQITNKELREKKYKDRIQCNSVIPSPPHRGTFVENMQT